MILEMYYEGTAQVSCPVCEEIYEIHFQGSTRDAYELIKDSLSEEGWKKDKCPGCRNKLN